MLDERKYLAQLEKADAAAFADMLRNAGADQERLLRLYFGDEDFAELRELAARAESARATRVGRGNVVLLHGIMGSNLAEVDPGGDADIIWVNFFRLALGRFSRLPLADDAASLNAIVPAGFYKPFYSKQVQSLRASWNVAEFAYDWRLPVEKAADDLATLIDRSFGASAPVHLVAHSMGGLVARAFILRHPQRWQSMWDAASAGRLGGRLVMLGTPNAGSFAIPQLYFGMNDILKMIALVDVPHSLDELVRVAATFAGPWQMLPSPLRMPAMEPLYQPATYGPVSPLQARFDAARSLHQALEPVVEPGRMIYVAGYDQPTWVDIRDFSKLGAPEGYIASRLGDGTVPHRLGLLYDPSGNMIPTLYVSEEHSKLPNNAQVRQALDQVLSTGSTGLLATSLPAAVRAVESEADRAAAAQALIGRSKSNLEALDEIRRQLGSRAAEPPVPSHLEQIAGNLIAGAFFCSGVDPRLLASAAQAGASVPGGPDLAAGAPPPPAPAAAPRRHRILIRVVYGGIERVGDSGFPPPAPNFMAPQAVCLGQYVGVRPANAMLALDRAISAHLPGGDADLRIITEMIDRGLVRGELAEPFFLPDPRDPQRLIAIFGMGRQGGFGVPELTVLVHQMCWSLAQIGRRHLAAVLIGSGGAVGLGDAVEAWLRGIRRALRDAAQAETVRVDSLTFVEFSAGRALALHRALGERGGSLRQSLGDFEIDLLPLADAERDRLQEEDRKQRIRAALTPASRRESEVPSRLTVEFPAGAYRFGIITEDAALPEREVKLDRSLVDEVNDRLVSAPPAEQAEWGECLQRLLIPSEIRSRLSSDAPLVITCDTTAAQVHWEMMAQPVLDLAAGGGAPAAERFLGLYRGLTRQLKTSFAPVPEPPTPARQSLRILVVADPVAEARLPGAMREAQDVLRLFEEYNRTRPTAPLLLVPLLGPAQATRVAVLKELLLHSYDILHFAGHCRFDAANPEASGWIFSGGHVLGASELSRLDRVPRFIFSNACESGVLPDRAEKRSAALAPSFAEAFFARGVGNLVCTAWPVNDAAASTFAVTFYSEMLGIDSPAKPMYAAMRAARLAIAGQPAGARTWGAYQHYGNPYFRFFRAGRGT
jgi:pimeloyl-ACP methyl ester carboxylesterase